MPKVRRKPLGNPKLDKKKKPLPPVSLLEAEKGQAQNTLTELKTKLETLNELLQHYKINRDDENRWFMLSLRLADDYVPAMHHEKKRGRQSEWSWEDELALLAIIELTKKQKSCPYSYIYENISKYIGGTKLERFGKMAAKTVKKHHTEFKTSSEFKVLQKLWPLLQDFKENAEIIAAVTVFSPDYHHPSKKTRATK